jgi:COP9 signalosome complex subunit 12
MFQPIMGCIRRGDLKGFDDALQENEEELIKMRIFLTLERGRDIALRNLFRNVFLAGGFIESQDPGATRIRRTRVPVAEFQVAINLMSEESVDTDEVECLLANMIYKVRNDRQAGRLPIPYIGGLAAA